MKKQKIFRNKRSISISIIIEPAGEIFMLSPDQEAIFEIDYDEISDPMTIDFWDKEIVFYEEAGLGITIHIEGKEVYHTNWG